MKYVSFEPISRVDALDAIQSGEPKRVVNALLRAALHDEEREWLENLVLPQLSSSSPLVRNAAAMAVSHIVRLHHALDLERIVPAVRLLLNSEETEGNAEQALEDIDIFVHNKRGDAE